MQFAYHLPHHTATKGEFPSNGGDEIAGKKVGRNFHSATYGCSQIEVLGTFAGNQSQPKIGGAVDEPGIHEDRDHRRHVAALGEESEYRCWRAPCRRVVDIRDRGKETLIFERLSIA